MSLKQSNHQSQSTSLRSIASLMAVGLITAVSAIFLLNDGAGGTIEVTGKDGPGLINLADEVVNQYTSLSVDVASGATSIQVSDINDLSNGSALENGDLVLIVQMQGASISTANDASFGTVADYHEAGNYEFIFVEEVSGSQITFQSGLLNTYTATGKTQIVRVPQYSTLEIQSGASITAPAWNGSTGGVVAVTASDTVTVAAGGMINANAIGFRGGNWHNGTAYGKTVYYSSSGNDGAEKGESVAGSSSDYTSAGYLYGRGAIANGGGGGNAHNAGGGGGANGNNGNVWTGQGVMCTTCPGASAWALDDAYISIGGYTTSSGGGRGGYSYAGANRDALSKGPGHNSWNGDHRSPVGGLGGRWLTSDADEKLFLGGGGGAGDANNNAGGDGGNGGGLVFIIAKAVKGAGTISANGGAGENTRSGHNDAPGGGGAGGTVVIKSNYTNGISIDANGGDGGNQLITNSESEGPGGGGGGGFVSLPAGATVTSSVAGGSSGTTSSGSLTEFPANGSTNGAEGELSTTIYIHYPQSGTTFPVEWLGVTGDWQGEDAVIQWITASETHSDYFALERSSDGETFMEIERVDAAGFSEEMIAYELIDKQAARLGNTALTYRLRQVDIDGKYEFSPTVELSVEEGQFPLQVSVYPNPARDHMNLSLTASKSQPISWSVYSLAGQKLMQGTVQADGQTPMVRLDVSSLSSGRYLLQCRGRYEGKSIQFVKQ